MAEPWLLVEELPGSPGVAVDLPPEELRHARSVLRLGDGAPVVLADGHGGTARAVLRRSGRGRLVAETVSVTRHPAPRPGVTLALCVLHTQAMDWAVHKAVEVGVERLVPVLSERVQLGRSAVRGRLGHWQRVARQALKQCRRPWAMEFVGPASLGELAAWPPGVVADPGGAGPEELAARLPVTLLVGPEGGLTPSERHRLGRCGWRSLRLGPYTLRAETAATVGSALLGLLGASPRVPGGS